MVTIRYRYRSSFLKRNIIYVYSNFKRFCGSNFEYYQSKITKQKYFKNQPKKVSFILMFILYHGKWTKTCKYLWSEK